MDQAAPQAAPGGKTSGDELTLSALRYGWGDAYEIGFDSERGWHARRRDGRGSDITAADHAALWEAVRADYDLEPVPRSYSAPLED
jgi:hypothetical protein